MENRPEALYLDLIKKALTFILWPEPPVPVDEVQYPRPLIKRGIVRLVTQLLRFKNLQLVITQTPATLEQREEGRTWPGYADTMVGLRRLDNLQFCIEVAIQEGIEGDLIETGVWKGGACILMRAVLAAHAIEDRKVYVADSFEGLPKPDAQKYPSDKGDMHYSLKFLAVSQEEVENNFRRYGLFDDQVVFLKGWFKDTLPTAPIEKLAVLRLDGDMYGSTMDSLRNLYPRLSKGGFCIVDDYALVGCKNAVDDFRAEQGINSKLEVVDYSCRYWRKT